MSVENSPKPKVGIPWRTSDEERQGVREKLENYFAAVRRAGAEAEEISLSQPPDKLAAQMERLEGFVLPGSPADVEPSRYGAARHEKTKTLDAARDKTDSTILDHAIAERKPERVALLDEGFSGNDQLKANAVQIFKTKGVTSFKTV